MFHVANKNILLSVFHFGKNKKNRALEKLARKGNGKYKNITPGNATNKLLEELQALKIK